MTAGHFEHRANVRPARFAAPRWADVLADRYRDRYDAEANYYRAMCYMSGLLWLTGRGPQALLTLTALIADERGADVSEPATHALQTRRAGGEIVAWRACHRWQG